MTLQLRCATMADARTLFDWRNDPVTRAASHHTEVLSFESHAGWLDATLANPLRKLLLAEEQGTPVGTVRIDLRADGSALLSWSVAPEARGRGVATQMVSMAIQDMPAGCVVRAEIKAGNVASVKVAEAVGMRMSGQDGDTLYFVRDVVSEQGPGRVD